MSDTRRKRATDQQCRKVHKIRDGAACAGCGEAWLHAHVISGQTALSPCCGGVICCPLRADEGHYSPAKGGAV